MLAIALLAIEIASCYQRNHVLSLTSRLMHYNALLSSDTSLEAETSASNIRKSVRLINLVNEYTSYDLAWKWQQELVDYHIDLQSASKGTDDIVSVEDNHIQISISHIFKKHSILIYLSP